MVGKPSASAISIGRYNDLVTSWLAAQMSANTRSAYRSDLDNFGQWCAREASIPLRAGTKDIVSYQKACVSAGQSPSTVRRRSSSLSSFFQYAVDAGTIAANPVLGSNRPPVTTGDPSPTASLDAEFVEQYLLGAAEFDSRLHALVALLVFDGLKLGEALALDTDDLSGRPSRFAARVARPEGVRRIVLHRHSSAAVRRCAGDRRNEPLFVSGRRATDSTPARLTRFGANHLIRQVPGPDGPPVTTNELRRFYVVSSHAAGVDLETIRVRAGLGDRRTAKRFLIAAKPASTGRRGDNDPNDPRDPQHDAAVPGSDRRPRNKEV